jgi:hypothetical protein
MDGVIANLIEIFGKLMPRRFSRAGDERRLPRVERE